MAPPQTLSSTNATHIASLCSRFGLTAAEFDQLRTRCAAAKAAAYCPYSRFRVGAALLLPVPAESESGPRTGTPRDTSHIVIGANVENVSYPAGTCAERAALTRAVVDGHREFRAIAVSTDISPPASPCGICRQL